MFRRFTRCLALALLASAPPMAEVDMAGLFDPAEVECLTRAPERGVRWVWDGAYCVGLLGGAASAPEPGGESAR